VTERGAHVDELPALDGIEPKFMLNASSLANFAAP
jgi:hypothetical protein